MKLRNNLFLEGAWRPWNIHTPSFMALASREIIPIEGMRTLSDWRGMFAQFIPQRAPMSVDGNGIAHVSIHGPLLYKEAPFFVAGYGGTDYAEILSDLETANKEAKGILLHVDSPGGHACGNHRVAQAVSSSEKPVFAYADGMCCSAAYAIAAGAAYVGGGADGTIGSIGTILPLMDVSGLWERIGIKADYITNSEGDLKTAGFPPSQNEAERASLQAETQQYFELFKGHVEKHRAVPKEAMRGQAFVGKQALANALLDEVGSMESVYKKLVNLTGR